MSLRRSYHSRRHNLNHNNNHNNYVRRNTPILFDVHGYRDSTISDDVGDDDDDDDERVVAIDHPICVTVTDQLDSNISGESLNQEGERQIENFDNVLVEGLGAHSVGEIEIIIVDNDVNDSGVSSSERVNKNNIA
ncbi:hypothetical protein P8452_34198 [Trifolium repens]|nr:hypothetical protein P8452_34198 [Trifolium repens]